MQRAIDEDVKYNYVEAVQLYTGALSYFIFSLKSQFALQKTSYPLNVELYLYFEDEDNYRLKKLMRKKITEFLNRAEALQVYLPKGAIERKWCETLETQRRIFEAMEKQRFALILGSLVEHTQGRVNSMKKCVSNINGINASIASLDLDLDYKLRSNV